MAKRKASLGLLLVISLSLLPVIRWAMLQPLSGRFASISSTLLSFGQIAGLAGMAMFALVLVLSARLKFLEDFFGGLNGVYYAHHLFGAVSFILLLFHPVTLAGSYAVFSLKSAAILLIPFNDWPTTFGITALLLMIVFLVLTFFVKLEYQKWNLTHKFLGLAFFFAGLHAFLIPSDVSRDFLLRAYILGLAGVGLAAYTYWTLLSRWLAKKSAYTVRSVSRLGDAVIEVEMTPDNESEALKHAPGQFVFVSFAQAGISPESHPFSVTSAPGGSSLTIGVKALGDYTNALPNLSAGTKARVQGPFGRFTPQNAEQGKKQLWIAGGIGVTPFISMARNLDNPSTAGESGGSRDIDFYYCANNRDEAVYLDELQKISSRHANLKVITQWAGTQGYLNAAAVEKTSGAAADKEIFICGPPGMMKSLKSQFRKQGTPAAQIHTEDFGFL